MPVQAAAHGLVSRALKNGVIAKTGCAVCGNPKVEGHHDDYSKPLEVIWLCRPHHKERHVRLAREGRDPAKLIRYQGKRVPKPRSKRRNK